MTNPTPQGVTLREAAQAVVDADDAGDLSQELIEQLRAAIPHPPAPEQASDGRCEHHACIYPMCDCATPTAEPAGDRAYANGKDDAKLTPLLVPHYVCASDANRLYGESFGVDWIYENTPSKAAKPDQQAQAGEPDGVAEQQAVYEVCLAHWGPDNGVTVDAKTVLELLQSHHERLRVLRSNIENYEHNIDALLNRERELLDVITKKDAALQACVDAMQASTDQTVDTDTFFRMVHAAITQAEGAMK